jgi:hypothetical protein
MTRTASLVVVLTVVVCAAVAGQPKPDYSGEWALDLQRSTLDPRIAAGIEKGTITIVHRDPAFELRRVFMRSGKPDSVSFALSTDGVEKIEIEGQVTWHMRMTWEDGVLVARMTGKAPQGDATNVVHYRLLDGGRTLEARESFRGPSLQYDNIWILEK